MPYKQVILVRQDLKMPKGKLAVQVAHASIEGAMKTDNKTLQAWRQEGMKKVALKVADEKELIKYKQLAEDESLKTSLIIDAGRTFVEPGTVTVLGIGPDDEKKIDRVTGKLKMV